MLQSILNLFQPATELKRIVTCIYHTNALKHTMETVQFWKEVQLTYSDTNSQVTMKPRCFFNTLRYSDSLDLNYKFATAAVLQFSIHLQKYWQYTCIRTICFEKIPSGAISLAQQHSSLTKGLDKVMWNGCTFIL